MEPKHYFFAPRRRPPIVDMIIEERPLDVERRIRSGIQHGADAFGIQMEWLKPEFRSEASLREIFAYLADSPLYITNYRGGWNEKMSDEARMDELKTAVRAGARLVDFTADLFAPDKYEFARDASAADRQRRLADEFHSLGAQVLISSHVMEFRPCDEVVEIALEQQRRGADVAKIVTNSDTEDELWANLETTRVLKRELKIPFLFLSNGPWCKLHRMVGPYLGCCMWLCVDCYGEHSSLNQPTLGAVRAVVDSFDAAPFRPSAAEIA